MEFIRPKKRLVMGLGGGLVSSCRSDKVLEKLLLAHDNDYLISTVDMTTGYIKFIQSVVGGDRLWLDSGGFTLFKKQKKLGVDNPLFAAECEKMKKKFMRFLKLGHFKMCFELDNEYFREDEDLLSPKNYLREEIKAITGYYPAPVFKMHQGFQYWKDLCDSPLYPVLSIGGLAQGRQWHVYRPELDKMMKYARDCGKYVHLLGCSNVETTRFIMPGSVDFSIFRYAINIEKARNNFMKKISEGEIIPGEDVYESAGKDLSGRIPYKYLSRDIVLYAFADARAKEFLYEKQNDEMID